MATAALVSPTTTDHTHPPPIFSRYHQDQHLHQLHQREQDKHLHFHLSTDSDHSRQQYLPQQQQRQVHPPPPPLSQQPHEASPPLLPHPRPPTQPPLPSQIQHHSSLRSSPLASVSSMAHPPPPALAESRVGMSDEREGSHARQSLPSISEVISGGNAPYISPVSSSMSPSQSLPSPFAPAAPAPPPLPSRPFPDVMSERRTSPRAAHPVHAFPPPRPEVLSSLGDPSSSSSPSSWIPLSVRPSAPTSIDGLASHHPTHRLRPEHEGEPQQAEASPNSRSFHHALPPQPLPPLHPPPPPGQLPAAPFPSFPVSPRQSGPIFLSAYDSQRPTPLAHDEGELGRASGGSRYESTLHRAFETWDYKEALTEIAGHSRTIFQFAETFEVAAREQSGAHLDASRLPTENEVSHMINGVIFIKQHLEAVRTMVQQTRLNHERAYENGVRKRYEEDADSVCGDAAAKASFAYSKVKKRHGRTAPPGRCHSCNRIDTPEWRRGPDGARTLCNACGLHYAKLERKRQLEQRVIRPKLSNGEHS